MRRKSPGSRLVSFFSRQWQRLGRRWYVADKTPWVVAGIVVGVVGVFALLFYSLLSDEIDRRSLRCLALNIYFEARGEPSAGRYAVAEVTMNRVASSRYPDSVCAVVYEKRWDRLRRRYVSAFSWTEFDTVPDPLGDDWREAWRIAEDVYYGRHEPIVDGALLFHAAYIRPSWARDRKPVARIGRHLFYR